MEISKLAHQPKTAQLFIRHMFGSQPWHAPELILGRNKVFLACGTHMDPKKMERDVHERELRDGPTTFLRAHGVSGRLIL